MNDEECKRWKRGFNKQPAGMLVYTPIQHTNYLHMLHMSHHKFAINGSSRYHNFKPNLDI